MPALLCFLAVFLFIYAEFSLLIWLAGKIGIFGLILLLIGASVFGLMMVRARGWYALMNIRKQLAQGEMPTQSLFKSGIWIAAGVLFLIPGLLTDILAVLLLLPPVSALLEGFIKTKATFFSSKIFRKNDRTFYYYDGKNPYYDEKSEIFDAEFEKQADEDKRIK